MNEVSHCIWLYTQVLLIVSDMPQRAWQAEEITNKKTVGEIVKGLFPDSANTVYTISAASTAGAPLLPHSGTAGALHTIADNRRVEANMV